MRKLRILVLTAEPDSPARLRLEREVREIVEKLRATPAADRIEVTPCLAARPDDVLQTMNQLHPDVLHFSGHGSGPGGIVLENNAGGASFVSGKALVRVLRAVGTSVRLVVLNACHAIDQAPELAELVGCVIAMKDTVDDDAARVFSGGFYRAIGFGKSVENAFDQGVASMGLHNAGDEDVPVLVPRADVDPSALFLLAGDQVGAAEPGGTTAPGFSAVISDSRGQALVGDALVGLRTASQDPSGAVQLVVQTFDAESDAQLAALRPRHRASRLLVAYGNDGGLADLEDVQYEVTDQATIWRMRLRLLDAKGGSFADMGVNLNGVSYTGDDLAQLRARRLLLAEKLPRATPTHAGSTLETFVRGLGGFAITESPLPALYRQFGAKSGQAFLRAGRLALVAQLKASGIAEHILRLDLGPVTDGAVTVSFVGRRPKVYDNVTPRDIAVAGTCPLAVSADA